MVRRPIGYLEKRGIRSKDILGAVRVPPANKVQDLKDGFYSGEVRTRHDTTHDRTRAMLT